MADNQKTAAELAAEIKSAHERAIDEVKAIGVEASGKAKAGETLAAGLKESADDALVKMNGLTEQLAALEQKMARGAPGEFEPRKTLGQQFTDREDVKSWLASDPTRGKVDMQVKATITTSTVDAAGSVGGGIIANTVPGVQMLPMRRMTVRDLLTPGQMDSLSLDYIQETGFTNSAAIVAEGAAKPQSDIQIELVSTSAKVIAHSVKVSRQALSDMAQLRSIIDQRLMYGLAYAEELQLLNGGGGGSLTGLTTAATAYSAAFTPASASPIDQLRLAMLQAALAEYPATASVLNPIDWARIELTKDAEGRYVIGNPQGMAAPTLWGLPVVATQAMTVDKFLTGAFQMGAQVFDRWAARVEVGYENDDFTKNLVTLLCEERLALAIYRPESFIYGDFGFVA